MFDTIFAVFCWAFSEVSGVFSLSCNLSMSSENQDLAVILKTTYRHFTLFTKMEFLVRWISTKTVTTTTKILGMRSRMLGTRLLLFGTSRARAQFLYVNPPKKPNQCNQSINQSISLLLSKRGMRLPSISEAHV